MSEERPGLLPGAFSVGRTFKKKYREAQRSGGGKGPRAPWLAVLGGKDGSVFAVLHPQSCDRSCGHGFGRDGVACPGPCAEFGASNSRHHADSVRCRLAE